MAFEAERLSAGMGSFLFTHSSRTHFVGRLNSGVRHHMWPLGLLDLLILAPVAVLAALAIWRPTNRKLLISAVAAVATVAVGYTLFRPSARAAAAYHESQGGAVSQAFLDGVVSMLAVSRHIPTVVLVAALTLEVLALRSK